MQQRREDIAVVEVAGCYGGGQQHYGCQGPGFL